MAGYEEITTGCLPFLQETLIEDPQQIHCMLCGKRIFEKLTEAQVKTITGQV